MLCRYPALVCLTSLIATASAADDRAWLPTDPGAARASLRPMGVANRLLSLTVSPNQSVDFKSKYAPPAFFAERFAITLRDGRVLRSSALTFVGVPRETSVAPRSGSGRAVDALKGARVTVTQVDTSSGLQCEWSAVLTDGANYAREELVLTATKADVDVAKVEMLNGKLPEAAVDGNVPGSPIAAGNLFASIEHPMAESRVEGGTASSQMTRKIPLLKGQTVSYSAVIGVTPPGQMRRGFLRYVERERAHPYRPFLHYNSWYDIGYFTPYTAEECIDRINKFGQNLVAKRGAKLDSFLFDDGWDDYESDWRFHKGFPQGFVPVSAAAQKYGAAPGVWLSPWGGYGNPRKRRLTWGKANGFEVDSQGYALSGPKYYARFHEATLDLVTHQGINQFKLDGTGSPDKQYPGSAFASDFDAAIDLISDLRQAKDGLFINLTTGTWPSPFWTKYADSIWRGGEDHSFSGVGPARERWITYRDADTFQGVVRKGPLYPINSLMLHGIIYAQKAHDLNTDPSNDFRNEVRSYFGTGTQLQEMYITPDRLTSQNWDELAEAAKWSRANADVLVDTHWVGGDPNKLEVYGWGSWNARKGILVLRNPSDQPQAFSIEPTRVWELPGSVRGSVTLRPAYASDASMSPLTIPIGQSKVVQLAPFQVLVLESAKP